MWGPAGTNGLAGFGATRAAVGEGAGVGKGEVQCWGEFPVLATPDVTEGTGTSVLAKNVPEAAAKDVLPMDGEASKREGPVVSVGDPGTQVNSGILKLPLKPAQLCSLRWMQCRERRRGAVEGSVSVAVRVPVPPHTTTAAHFRLETESRLKVSHLVGSLLDIS